MMKDKQLVAHENGITISKTYVGKTKLEISKIFCKVAYFSANIY